MELQNRIRKIAGATVKPLEYDPGAQFEDAGAMPDQPQTQVILPAEYIAKNQEVPSLHELEPFSPVMEELSEPKKEIGSVEFQMKEERYKKLGRRLGLAYLDE
jgi:hypothetical protein